MPDQASKACLCRVPARRRRATQTGQALVELALVVPLLLMLVFGVVAVGRLVQAQMGVSAVVREAALSAAITQHADAGYARGQAVAVGYNLAPGALQLVVAGDFKRGGQVGASARYTVSFGDLPLLGWANLTVTARHVEQVDRYQSIWH